MIKKGASHTFKQTDDDRFVSTSVRIRTSLHDRISKLACARGMSLNAFANAILIAGVEEAEEIDQTRPRGQQVPKVAEIVQAGQEINHPDLGPGITPSLLDGKL